MSSAGTVSEAWQLVVRSQAIARLLIVEGAINLRKRIVRCAPWFGPAYRSQQSFDFSIERGAVGLAFAYSGHLICSEVPDHDASAEYSRHQRLLASAASACSARRRQGEGA